MIKLSARSSRFYLLVSIAAAVLAGITLLAYLHSLRSRIAESGKLVQLVVAARDLQAGEVLGPSSLSLVDFPDRYLLPGNCTDPLALTGATLRHSVAEGEPILESALLPPGAGLDLGSLDKGFRACPLPSSSFSFPSAALFAGDRVDILAVKGGEAALLLENVEVLSVFGASPPGTSDGGREPSWDNGEGCILLQVTEEEACRLSAAQEGGRVEILLRPVEH